MLWLLSFYPYIKWRNILIIKVFSLPIYNLSDFIYKQKDEFRVFMIKNSLIKSKKFGKNEIKTKIVKELETKRQRFCNRESGEPASSFLSKGAPLFPPVIQWLQWKFYA